MIKASHLRSLYHFTPPPHCEGADVVISERFACRVEIADDDVVVLFAIQAIPLIGGKGN